jgi:hypothetical protein
MIPVPLAGTLEAVDGLEAAQSVVGVTGVEISIPVGAEVLPVPDGDRYLGFVFARGETPTEVVEALRSAHERINVSVRP